MQPRPPRRLIPHILRRNALFLSTMLLIVKTTFVLDELVALVFVKKCTVYFGWAVHYELRRRQ